MFSSHIFPGEPVIGDDFDPGPLTHQDGMSRGLDLSLRGADGYRGVAAPFPDSLLVPEDEWADRAKELQEKGVQVSDIIKREGVREKNQNGFNYCWCYAVIQAVEVVRAVQNEDYVDLSANSVAAPVKDFRNVGGWGREALEYVIEKGVMPASVWPNSSISRQYLTPENLKLAEKYRVTEWVELTPRSVKQKVSALLRQMPVACGYNWWAHEILACDVIMDNGVLKGCRERNQWLGYGDQNFVILTGSKVVADDQVAPLVTTV